MEKKRALIITYYWPPSGGSGVQRWLKFTKYLPEYGWTPIIYTPSNPEFPVEDKSLFKDIPEGITVIKRPIKEPYRFYKFFTGKSTGDKIQTGFLNESSGGSIFEKVFRWIRGNFFIPDARLLWVKPSVKFLSKWLQENPVDVVVSTGPPHSMHLIALGLKKKHNIKWVADFRDPWTQIDYYQHLLLSKKADSKHKRLEREVLQQADRIISISNNSAKDFNKIIDKNINVITNGFDNDDFKNISKFQYDCFSITHLGSMNSDRNPFALWKALNEIINDFPELHEKLKIRFVGKTDYSVFRDIEKNGLTSFVENIKYLPHDEALKYASNSAILLLSLNNTPNIKSIATGKLFEYLALNRPVLCVGHVDGDAAYILNETGMGTTFNINDISGIKSYILERFQDFKKQDMEVSAKSINKYSRKELTGRVVEIFNSLT